MYRIDAICDRIYFNSIEAENAVNVYRCTSDQWREKVFVNLFKDFKSNETQMKLNKLINRAESLEELKIMFALIEKYLDGERETQDKGIATHMLAVLLNNIAHSEQLWKKIVTMITMKDTEILDKFIKRQSVMNSMSTVIGNYLNSLCEIEGEFFIDTNNDTIDSKQIKLFNSLELSHVILIIHHLLNHPKTATFFTRKIFTSFELSPSFITFLKLSLRTLSL